MEFQWSELIWPFECKPFQKLYIRKSKIEFLLPKDNKEGMKFVNNFSMQTMIFFNDVWKCPCQEQVSVNILTVRFPTAAIEIKM